jgi:hypothetical protein
MYMNLSLSFDIHFTREREREREIEREREREIEPTLLIESWNNSSRIYMLLHSDTGNINLITRQPVFAFTP